jgi:hypothetical protein
VTAVLDLGCGTNKRPGAVGLDNNCATFEQYRYSRARFRVGQVKFNERFPQRGLRARVTALANRRPGAYEGRLSHLFPLDELTRRLRVLKSGAP